MTRGDILIRSIRQLPPSLVSLVSLSTLVILGVPVILASLFSSAEMGKSAETVKLVKMAKPLDGGGANVKTGMAEERFKW